MSQVPPEILNWRKRTGSDQWDEMWNGVLHMVPAPNREHQDFEWALEAFLRARWARPRKCKVYHDINVASPGGWPHDYRIPDLVLLTPDRFSIDRNEYFEGAPAVVVEIRSEGDETYEKLDFYAAIGVPEVWIVDRDTRSPQIHVIEGDRYREKTPEASGWLRSDLTGIEMQQASGDKLSLRLADDPSSVEELPQD
jgi:Uma2 family endonuclease